MRRRTATFWLVESLSLMRLVAALLFASLAFQGVPMLLLASIYGFAMCSDLIDGYVARSLKATTYFGRVLDLVSDKSLTIVSLLYASQRGVSILPLALVAAREIIMIGARIVVIEGKQLLPTNKVFGGVLAFLLWGNTLFLVTSVSESRLRIVNVLYWTGAAILALNLVARVIKSSDRIKAALTRDL